MTSNLPRQLVTCAMLVAATLCSGAFASPNDGSMSATGGELLLTDHQGWWGSVVVHLSSMEQPESTFEEGRTTAAALVPAGSIELVECQYPRFFEGTAGPAAPRPLLEEPLPPVRSHLTPATCNSSTTGMGCSSNCCDDSMCGTPCCDPCCSVSCCRPSCTVAVDAIFLNRVDPDGDLALVLCNTCADVFKGRDFDLATAAGPRFRIFRHLCGSACGSSGCGDSCNCGSAAGCCGCSTCCEGYTLEAAYYNINGWNDKRTLTGDLTLFGATNLGANSTAIVLYDSSLQNLELNLRRPCGCWSNLIAGLRWLQLDEYSAVSGAGAVLTDARTVGLTNNLYGAHVGMQRLLYDQGGLLTVDATAKTGVAYNDINRHITGFGGAARKSKSGASFIGDLEFQANFEVTCNWTVTAGYQMLFLTGMAEASEQYFAPTDVIAGRFLFYHGANVGLAYTF